MGMIDNAPVAGTIGTGNIQDGGVETADIKDGAVTNAKIASGVDASKLTTGTLPTARLDTGAAVSNIGYTPVNKAGDTMTGQLNVSGVVQTQGNGTSTGYMAVNLKNGSKFWHISGPRGDDTGVALDRLAVFYNDGSAYTNCLNINTSGSVSLPLQPACQITRGNGSETFVSNTSYGLGSSFLLNRGGFYFGTVVDGTNKRVHVPATGLYECTFNVYVFYTGSNGKRVELRTSTGEVVCMHQMPGGSTGDELRSITGLVSLTAGDYFYFATANYGNIPLYTNNDHTEVFIKYVG